MSYLAEERHVMSCPYDTWQIVRISSATNKESLLREIQDMETYLNERFRDTSYKLEVGYDPDDMRRIYIKKLKKWKKSSLEEREYVNG